MGCKQLHRAFIYLILLILPFITPTTKQSFLYLIYKMSLVYETGHV